MLSPRELKERKILEDFEAHINRRKKLIDEIERIVDC